MDLLTAPGKLRLQEFGIEARLKFRLALYWGGVFLERKFVAASFALSAGTCFPKMENDSARRIIVILIFIGRGLFFYETKFTESAYKIPIFRI